VAKSDAVEASAEIAIAFVSYNSLSMRDLPALIETIHAAVRKCAAGGEIAPAALDLPAPAVSIRKSVTPDYLICLENGKRFKSLRRHLTLLGMTPEQYRAKWGLSPTYPMVAPNYAARRSELAKKMGLGQVRQKSVMSEPSNLEEGRAVAGATPGRPKRKPGRPR
jgi:predicted transcriptional regulator